MLRPPAASGAGSIVVPAHAGALAATREYVRGRLRHAGVAVSAEAVVLAASELTCDAFDAGRARRVAVSVATGSGSVQLAVGELSGGGAQPSPAAHRRGTERQALVRRLADHVVTVGAVGHRTTWCTFAPTDARGAGEA